jgi:hypothetical protein
MALDKIDADGLTNTQWKDVINGGIDAIEDNTMMSSTTINVTSTGSNPADVSVSMTGHVATSSPLTGSTAIQDAIALLPRNLDRHRAVFYFGGTEGNPQTIAINKELHFNGFTGYLVLTTKDGNDTGLGTKRTSLTNTLELVDGDTTASGRSVLEFFSCAKVAISGLKIKFSNTSCTDTQFAILSSTCPFVDIANCNIEGHRNTLDSNGKGSHAVLSQQGSVTRFRDGYLDNFYLGLTAHNTGRVFARNVGTISTSLAYGMNTGNGSIGHPSVNFLPTTTVGRIYKDNGRGSLLVDDEGLNFEREILTRTKTVTIPAGSTVSEITQIFRNLPHNLNGRTLTVKFTSGADASNPEVYDFGSDTLYIRGFHGGNLSVTTTAGSEEDDQRVLIKGNPVKWKGVVNFDDCLFATLNNVRIETYGDNTGSQGMESLRISESAIHCHNVKFKREGVYLHSSGVRSNHAVNVRLLDCKFEDFHYAALADHQSNAFHLQNCQSVGLRGGYGLVAYNGSIMSESGSNKVTSQLGNKVAAGGLITHNSGMILNERIAQSTRRFKIAASDTPSDYIYRDESGNNIGALSTADVVYSRNTITDAVLSGGTVTITTSSAHGYDPNADGSYRVYISSLGYTGVNPNGSRKVVSAPTPTTFTFPLTGANETFTTSGATVSNIDMVKQLIGDATKVLNGYDVQFYFASGTYDWGFGTLNFKGFNGGQLSVYGHQTDSNSSLTTIMKTKDTNDNGVFMFEKSNRCLLTKMAFIQYGTNNDTNVVEVPYSSYLILRNCTFVNENTKANDAISVYDGRVRIEETTFSNFDRNVVLTDFSEGYMKNTVTATSGVDANHHIRCINGSNMRTSGSQASFSGNERESGGTIFNSSGNIV